MTTAPTSPPKDPAAPRPRDPDGERPGLLADLRAVLRSDEVALKVLVASVVVLAVGWLGVKEAVGGVIASQVLSETVKRWVQRQQLKPRQMWLATLLLLLLSWAKSALAAVRHPFRNRRRDGSPPGEETDGSAAGRRAGALTSLLACLFTVLLFTAPELVIGDSLVDDRQTTFFGGREPGPARQPAPPRPTPPGPNPDPHPTPILELPNAIVREADGPRGTIVTYTTRAHDAEGRRLTADCRPHSGTRFGLGERTVSCSATSVPGTTASGSFTVAVRDTTDPTLRLPARLRVATTSASGTRVAFTVTASDAVSGALRPRCSPASGTRFPLGRRTVRCTATDRAGNGAVGTFVVDVRHTSRPDRKPPNLTLSDAIRIEATSKAGAIADFKATATDAVSGRLMPDCRPASGTLLPIGVHRVRCTATDNAGNASRGAFTLTVFDAPPVVSVPADIRVPYSTPAATPVAYPDATADDRVDGALPAPCSPPSRSDLPLGATSVTCAATDSAGQSTSKSFTVTVFDHIPPRLTLPKRLVRLSPYGLSVSVTYPTRGRGAVRARDAVDGRVKVKCRPLSGSSFSTGRTWVSCRASDRAGNRSRGRFLVVVEDTSVD